MMVVILALMAYLTHMTIFTWFYTSESFGGSPALQLQLIFLVGIVIIWLLRLGKGEQELFSAFQKNGLVTGFVTLTLLSMAWSVTPATTTYRALLTLFVTFIAAYVGLRLSTRNLVNYIAIMIGIFAAVSLFL